MELGRGGAGNGVGWVRKADGEAAHHPPVSGQGKVSRAKGLPAARYQHFMNWRILLFFSLLSPFCSFSKGLAVAREVLPWVGAGSDSGLLEL